MEPKAFLPSRPGPLKLSLGGTGGRQGRCREAIGSYLLGIALYEPVGNQGEAR